MTTTQTKPPGRPKLFGDREVKRLSLSLPLEVYERLRIQAAREGDSSSKIIAELVEGYLEEAEGAHV